MSKSKQTKEASAQDEPFLFAIGTPAGDTIVKVGVDGNILHIKDGISLTEASKAFWNSFQVFLPITVEDVEAYSNDEELGKFVRSRMQAKLNP